MKSKLDKWCDKYTLGLNAIIELDEIVCEIFEARDAEIEQLKKEKVKSLEIEKRCYKELTKLTKFYQICGKNRDQMDSAEHFQLLSDLTTTKQIGE